MTWCTGYEFERTILCLFPRSKVLIILIRFRLLHALENPLARSGKLISLIFPVQEPCGLLSRNFLSTYQRRRNDQSRWLTLFAGVNPSRKYWKARVQPALIWLRRWFATIPRNESRQRRRCLIPTSKKIPCQNHTDRDNNLWRSCDLDLFQEITSSFPSSNYVLLYQIVVTITRNSFLTT